MSAHYDALVEELLRVLIKMTPFTKERFRRPLSYYTFLLAAKTDAPIIEGVFANPFAFNIYGIGKSVYCLKTLVWIYGSWVKAKEHVFFEPLALLEKLERAADSGVKIPSILWDDAGFWINAHEWQTALAVVVSKEMNILRLATTQLLVTAPLPRSVLRSVREQMRLIHLVRLHTYSEDVRKRRAYAKTFVGYDHYLMYLRGKSTSHIDYYYSVYFPHYGDYEAFRREITSKGTKISKEELKMRLKELRKKIEGARLEAPEPVRPEEVRLEDLGEPEEGGEDG